MLNLVTARKTATPPQARATYRNDRGRIEIDNVGIVLQNGIPTPTSVVSRKIHGGAGTIERSKMTSENEREYRAGLERALTAGYEILKRGGSSLDATEAAVRVLEREGISVAFGVPSPSTSLSEALTMPSPSRNCHSA